MISIATILDRVRPLDGQARIVEVDQSGRQAVQFRAFSTDTMITATHPDGETLVGCVVFAEIQDDRIDPDLVNIMNQRIDFGGVALFDRNVAIVKSGQLFDPEEASENFDKLLTAWSDTIDQFWAYLEQAQPISGVN